MVVWTFSVFNYLIGGLCFARIVMSFNIIKINPENKGCGNEFAE